jgi:two-component system response regulator AgrA
MLKIYLCEDDTYQLTNVKLIINEIINDFDIPIDLKAAVTNAEALLELIEENDNDCLYFLDIELRDSINGLELAYLIREKQPRAFIVFITSHPEMSFMTFQYNIEALDYLVKNSPNDLKIQITKCINTAIKRIDKQKNVKKTFSITIKGRTVIEDYDNILFFEKVKGKGLITMHCKHRAVSFWGSLNDIVKGLPDDFYRCRDNCIVNRINIKEIDRRSKTIYFENGSTCLVSVRALSRLI